MIPPHQVVATASVLRCNIKILAVLFSMLKLVLGLLRKQTPNKSMTLTPLIPDPIDPKRSLICFAPMPPAKKLLCEGATVPD